MTPAVNAPSVINLYRAVGTAEAESIEATGAFTNPYGTEVKYFSTTLGGAQNYAAQAQAAFGDGPYSIVSTQIPAEAVTPEMQVIVDRGIPTVTVPTQELPKLALLNLNHNGERIEMIKPDVIAKVSFYSEAQGGRRSATPLDHLGCIFVYEGDNFECRLLLQDVGPIVPGGQATVPIKFLWPEAKQRLRVGSRFTLREAKPIGEGIIESLVQ